jgi:hypothetical protein
MRREQPHIDIWEYVLVILTIFVLVLALRLAFP